MSLKMLSTLALHYFIMACNFITQVTISLPFFDQFTVVLYSVTFKFHTTVCSYVALYMGTPLQFKLLQIKMFIPLSLFKSLRLFNPWP